MSRTVLLVNASGEISGAERSLLAILDALAGTPWRPVVAAPPGALLREVAARGVTGVEVPLFPRRRIRGLLSLWRAIKEIRAELRALAEVIVAHQPHLVHANSTTALLVLPKNLPRPVIWQVRDLTSLWPLGRYFYRQATRVATISSVVRDAVMAYADDGGAKIFMLPPAVDTERFTPVDDPRPLRRGLGLPEDIPLLGMVAQFVPWKRHDLLFEALGQITDLPWRLALAGADFGRDDAYVATVREWISTPPLAGRVTWLPWQGDPVALYQALDLCVLPSHREPFGRAVLEAMACGVPAIATDDGGAIDQIIDGETGLLVPPDATALAEAIRGLLRDAPLRQTMGAAARARAVERFSLPQHREALLALYGESVANFNSRGKTA